MTAEQPHVLFLTFSIIVLSGSVSNACVPTIDDGSSIACPSLHVVNGIVKYSPDSISAFKGTAATYTCNSGYAAVGNARVVCQSNGRWSADLGTCEQVCADFPAENDPHFDKFTYSATPHTDQSTVTKVCKSGYDLTDITMRSATCTAATSTWSLQMFPKCIPACAPFVDPDPRAIITYAGQFGNDPIKPGTVAEKACTAGFSLCGANFQATCDSAVAGGAATYTPNTLPVCVDAACGGR